MISLKIECCAYKLVLEMLYVNVDYPKVPCYGCLLYNLVATVIVDM